MKLELAKKLNLRGSQAVGELVIRDIIAENPSILGLGDLILKDKERRQTRGGRLDLLFQSAASDGEKPTRYEVELQLGDTDESHIIRTIEYWDYERKRFPQYEHQAVLIAENVTGRFFNVISLFNSAIPITAIQMSALQVGEHTALHFTTVLDPIQASTEEEEETFQVVDHSYWEQKAPKTMGAVEQLINFAKECGPGIMPKYNQAYIGMTVNGQVDNFITLTPAKASLRLSLHIERSADVDQQIEAAGIDLIEYKETTGWRAYRLRLKPEEVAKHRELLTEWIQRAHRENTDVAE